MGLYKDIDLNFTLDAKGDLAMVEDIESINQGLRILVETLTGSRPGYGNELFGIYLKQYLFSELSYNVANQIGSNIAEQIEKYEPRINLENVNVEMNEHDKAYLIDVLYSIRNNGKVGNFRMVVSLL